MSRAVWRGGGGANGSSSSKERHYCAMCNVWMGSDRPSILTHENGKKHKEAVEKSLVEKRELKNQKERQSTFLSESLAQMEAHAAASFFSNNGVGADGRSMAPIPVSSSATSQAYQRYYAAQQIIPPPSSHQPPQPVGSSLPHQQQQQQLNRPPNKYSTVNEKKEWDARKKKREEENHKRRRRQGDDEDDDENDENGTTNNGNSSKRSKLILPPGVGHYSDGGEVEYTPKSLAVTPTTTTTTTTNSTEKNEPSHGNDTSNNEAAAAAAENTIPQSKTYLEGVIFGDVLEEEMPIQLWMGPEAATDAEKRLPNSHRHWIDAVVVSIRRRKTGADDDPSALPFAADRMAVDVAYLQEAPNRDAPTIETEKDNDIDALVKIEEQQQEKEVLLKSVPLNRIRIVLGADETIPDTLEEARLLGVGGELEVEIIDTNLTVSTDADATQKELEEATGGLGSWATVKVKKVTVRHELRQERARQREVRKQAALEQERLAKQLEERKMEEAKVANADDSALGAYDIWSRGKKEGYKGVDIHQEATIEGVHELGKKLAKGQENVGFKKVAVANKKKKQNRRTTSADD